MATQAARLCLASKQAVSVFVCASECVLCLCIPRGKANQVLVVFLFSPPFLPPCLSHMVGAPQCTTTLDNSHSTLSCIQRGCEQGRSVSWCVWSVLWLGVVGGGQAGPQAGGVVAGAGGGLGIIYCRRVY